MILGNPPYYKFAGVAEDEEHDLIAPYSVGIKERFHVRPRAINDLYVRFLRLAERQIAETTGRGVVSFITNNGWLDHLSYPVMREHMIAAFDRIWIDNLNGGGRFRGSRGPDGMPDRSAFEYVGGQGGIGITVPTAIACMVKTGNPSGLRSVLYRDLWGQGAEKRQRLRTEAEQGSSQLALLYEPIQPAATSRLMLHPGGGEDDYLAWPALDDIFVQQFPGILTSRDGDLVSIEPEPLRMRMRQYYDPAVSDDEIARIAPSLMRDTNRFAARPTRRQLLASSRYRDDRVIRVSYRPLDNRWLYWESVSKLLDEKRSEFFDQVFDGNLYVEAVKHQRKSNTYDHGIVVTNILDYNFVDGGARCFPLYVREQGMFAGTKPNVQDAVLAQLEATYGPMPNIAEVLFFHIVAVLNSPEYRTENAGAIEHDWPRVPIPAPREALEASAALGRRVGDLLRPDVGFTPPDELRGLAAPRRVDGGQFADDDLRVTVRYGGVGRYEPPAGTAPARLWWNDRAFWHDVPPAVWAFTIGGYPVVKKWLDYRHVEKLGRGLTLDEVRYVREMIQRIAALLALGPALDASYAAVKAAALPLPAGA